MALVKKELWGGFHPMPFLSVVGVAAIAVGTMVGQGDHDRGSGALVDDGPMAGMDHSAMAGMDHSTGGEEMNDANMPGMDHSSSASKQPEQPMAGMDMSMPGMAAGMPGGFHQTCKKSTCTIVFAKDASGTATSLGSRIALRALTGSAIRLDVDGRPVRLQKGRSLDVEKLTFTVVRLGRDEATVKVVRH